jgi:hypothetical protein
LAAETPASTPELQRQTRRATPYTLAEALLYPFRGLGSYLFWGYVILLSLFQVLAVLPGVGCLIFVFELMILFILPGLLFAVVRTTAEGDNELPDWPDWSMVGERLHEWLGAVLVFMVAAVPIVAALLLSRCGPAGFLGESTLQCALALTVGVLLAAAVWVPAFGAVGTYSMASLALRLDRHVRALVELGSEALKTLGLLVALQVLRQITALALAPVPLLGTVLQIAIATYALFAGAHLVGLLFRRHAAQMESIYL